MTKPQVRLHGCSSVPGDWSARLEPYGYETVAQLLGTCEVDGGVLALAEVLQVSEDEVLEVAAALRYRFVGQLSGLAPVTRPLGALLDEEDDDV